MRRRHRHRSHTNHERWLVSYADFITLLFAFFVVLYASAQVDRNKVGRLAAAIQEAFQQLGVFPGNQATSTKTPSIDALQAIRHLKEDPPPTIGRDHDGADENNLAQLESELRRALASEIVVQSVSLRRETEGLVISLREFGFFDSGSAALKPAALPALEKIAAILNRQDCRVRIEGHTDDVPIHTANVPSNWELSTARASELVRLLIVRYGFSPERLSAAGYAQYHPIADNGSVQGRAQNRRVDIVILSGHIVPRSSGKPSAAKP